MKSMTCAFRSIPSLARNRGPVWFLLGFALLLFALPASAQTEDPALDAPARFLIETITVEGADRPASREIVAKESRIATGTEVDEEDLRQAIYRVKRLPFVVDADFTLRKGSERGRYELVIRIEMASSIVVDLTGGRNFAAGYPLTLKGFDWYGTLGARRFIGSHGYAFGSIDRFRNLQVGYTQFHLFGPGSYLSLVTGKNLEDKTGSYGLSALAGKPLTATQALRASVSYSTSDQFDSGSADLDWLFDTTDDPLLPAQGDALSVSALYGSNDFSYRALDGSLFRFDNRNWQVAASARHYWPLASRHSVWGELTAACYGFLQSQGGVTSHSSGEVGSVNAGYSWDLIRSQVGEPRNDLRFTTAAHFSGAKNQYPGFETGFAKSVLAIDMGLIYRRPQGSISLTFTYLDEYYRRRLAQ